MNQITVGVAEDQQIFRKGLVLLLNSFENITVTQEANDGSVLLDLMAENCPDVVILDYSMPIMGGIETCKQIRKRFEGVKVLILSMYDDENFVETAIENGANGYLSKDDDLSEIESAIQGILKNNYYLNDRVSKVFIDSLMKQGKLNPKFANNTIEFTPDELRVLHLISQENTTQQIADTMNKSIRTIEKYRTRMMEKVGAQNSIGLIMYAVKNNIL